MTQHHLADNEIDIEASRALILKACSAIDTDTPSAHIASTTKTFVAEAVNRVVDRSLQVCGSMGIPGDTALSRLYREVRPFRIYDGPSETHRWVIARRALHANQHVMDSDGVDIWRGLSPSRPSSNGRAQRGTNGSIGLLRS